MNNSKKQKILVVDDEEDIRALIKGILEDEDYEVFEAANSDAAFAAIETENPDLIVLDIWLQGSEKDGMEILETLKAQEIYRPVLMISGHGTIETAVSAIKNGAYDFIEKPFKSDRLLLMISRALEMAQLRNENRRLKIQSNKSSDNLIGKSAAINTLRQQINKIAPSNSRVFIKGEAGTGKEVVAREIHQQSARKNETFMALNCAALHPERLEEELFGVLIDDTIKKGVLELADGGTLFLDEVVDMPIETQGKILRVLQENKFEPVGSHKTISVDVRVIASTNKDVDVALKEGQFRQDLLYRLNVVTLDIPPLHTRKEDIGLLALHFVNFFALQMGQDEKEISAEVQSIFKKYPWPGNVRQLKNVMEWITIMNNFGEGNNVVEPAHLPPEMTVKSSKESSADVPDDNIGQIYMNSPLREAREKFEKIYLTEQVIRFDGNISQTAEFIGMERSALHRKLKSLDICVNDAQNNNQGNQPANGQKLKSA